MDYICTKCNYKGQRKKINGGSNLVSIMLWTVLPTLYMLWEFHAAGDQVMQDPMSIVQKSGGFSYLDILLNAPGPVYSIWRRIKKLMSVHNVERKL